MVEALTFFCCHIIFLIFLNPQLKMLARSRAGQRDGRRRQADDDFGGWVKMTVLFLAVSGQNLMKFWDDVGDP